MAGRGGIWCREGKGGFGVEVMREREGEEERGVNSAASRTEEKETNQTQ